VADIPEDVFDNAIEDMKAKRKQITNSVFYKISKKSKRPKKTVDLIPSGNYQLIISGIEELHNHIEPNSIDYIITDPPYPQKYLNLYGDLARFSSYALKPGGSLLAMAGQSYLPSVMSLLAEHLTYQWVVAYLTPGGQSPQIWPRKVNSFWKPVLWFVKGEYNGRWIGDVNKSDVNDNDKSHHHWGQSESGMANLVRRFTEPGHIICDPFLGGGTTAVVSLATGRNFIGADIDPTLIDAALLRIGNRR